jgi:hypothetical protein
MPFLASYKKKLYIGDTATTEMCKNPKAEPTKVNNCLAQHTKRSKSLALYNKTAMTTLMIPMK